MAAEMTNQEACDLMRQVARDMRSQADLLDYQAGRIEDLMEKGDPFDDIGGVGMGAIRTLEAYFRRILGDREG